MSGQREALIEVAPDSETDPTRSVCVVKSAHCHMQGVRYNAKACADGCYLDTGPGMLSTPLSEGFLAMLRASAVRRHTNVDTDAPDGTAFPWAEDLDGVWHLRPADDEWGDPAADVQAHGVCGASFGSVHVSAVKPTPDPYVEDSLCDSCAAFTTTGDGL